MIRTLFTALRIELLSLLRTREVYSVALMPSLLFVPAVLAVVILFVSVSGVGQRVAVPDDLPAEIDLRTVPAAKMWIQFPDPAAAYASGHADVAITSWNVRELIGDPDRPWMALEVEIGDEGSLYHLERVARNVAKYSLDHQIEKVGGVRRIDRKIAILTEPEEPSSNARELRQISMILYTMLAMFLGVFFLPGRTTSDRIGGILEAYAVVRAPVVAVYGMRAVLAAGLFLTVLSLPIVMTGLVVGPPLDEMVFEVRALDLLESSLTILLVNVLLIVCGMVASSVRIVMQLAGLMLLVLTPVLMLPLGLDLPAWPVLGFVEEASWPVQTGRLVGLMVLIGGALWVVERLARSPLALPPGEGDE